MIGPDAYPRIPPADFRKLEPRTPLPVYPPPEPLDRPPLPSPPRKPRFAAPYTLSTHIIPAAYLRTSKVLPIPASPPLNASKEEKRRVYEETRRYLLDSRNRGNTDGHIRLLWNCVNRYVRNDLKASDRKGYTLFLAHANGFPKEIWEPFLARLLASSASTLIDEVWAWEAVQHGDSALINGGKDTIIFDWWDNARDIANFFLHFIPNGTDTSPLPTHLQRVSSGETASRISQGFKDRRFIALGHSFGGATSALAASMYPKLFKAIILVDPVIVAPFETTQSEYAVILAVGALSRREEWSSRQEAHESFLKSPFFQAWDPDVVSVYVECGLYDYTDPETAKTSVRLKMSGLYEAAVFTDLLTAAEAYQTMPSLNESIALRWVMPGKPGSREVGAKGSTAHKVWVRPENSSNTKILGGGHLIAQEAPQELAVDVEGYLFYLSMKSDTNHRKASL